MTTIRCKFCGGDVDPLPVDDLGICLACGCTVTLPAVRDDRRIASHNCGNYFRRMGNFDKALSVFRGILQQDPTDAEASWCCVLCKFGVLYEPDPESGGFFPVCRRPGQQTILQDGDYLTALENSGGAVQMQYRQDAGQIAAALSPQDGGRTPEEAAAPAAPVPERGTPPQTAQEPAAPNGDLLKKAFSLLSQGEWAEADRICDAFLVQNPESAMAYLGKLLSQQKCRKPAELMQCTAPIDDLENYRKALQYADADLQRTLKKCAGHIKKQQVMAAYQRACTEMDAAATAQDYRKAAALFSRLAGFRDAGEKKAQCLSLADALSPAPASETSPPPPAKAAPEEAARKGGIPGWIKFMGIAVIASLILGVSAFLLITRYIIPEGKYRDAENMLANGDREAAIAAFEALAPYKDAEQRAEDIRQEWYAEAERYLSQSDRARAAASFGGLGDYADARQRSRELWDTIVPRPTLCAGGRYTAALRSDGMAYAVGDNQDGQCDVGGWMNMISLSAGWSHTAALRADGTVVAVGYNGDGRCDVENWQDIVSISLGQWHTVGLKSDGRVIAAGCGEDGRTDVSDWQEIMAVSAGRNHTLGLRMNYTVAAAGMNDAGQCDVSGWHDIRQISAGGSHSLGLRINGTVAAAGSNEEGQCEVDGWSGITAVAAGYYHSVGLRADGTVVAVGLNQEGQCDVSEWTDIVAIAAGGWHTVGLKADGTIVAAGRNMDEQCNTAQWVNMRLPQ